MVLGIPKAMWFYFISVLIVLRSKYEANYRQLHYEANFNNERAASRNTFVLNSKTSANQSLLG